jgi:hypothetical protein|tara:strand:+ start:223 stop:429 length:207 start_codon:yes stop_codon:yes gene_type:complete
MAVALADVQALALHRVLLSNVVLKHPIGIRYLAKKVAAFMEPVVPNTNLGSFLIWGLEIRRNISFDKV